MLSIAACMVAFNFRNYSNSSSLRLVIGYYGAIRLESRSRPQTVTCWIQIVVDDWARFFFRPNYDQLPVVLIKKPTVISVRRARPRHVTILPRTGLRPGKVADSGKLDDIIWLRAAQASTAGNNAAVGNGLGQAPLLQGRRARQPSQSSRATTRSSRSSRVISAAPICPLASSATLRCAFWRGSGRR
jgi:hypothetical protein